MKKTVYEVVIETADGRVVSSYVAASSLIKASKYVKADYPGCTVVSVRNDGQASKAWAS